MVNKKSKLSKKLEQFRKTQEINALVAEGAIEEDAIQDSASDAKPAEESHAYDIIERTEGSGMLYKQQKSKSNKSAPKPGSKRKKAHYFSMKKKHRKSR